MDTIEDLERLDITPGMEKIYDTVIPSLGHDMITAPGDLVDNSIDAGATNIEIYIEEDKNGINKFMIADNGSGMTKSILHESNRIGAATTHSPGANGKFGTGGSIASYTLGNRKTTYTRYDVAEFILKSILSLEAIGSPRPLQLGVAGSEETTFFNELIPETGTLIIIDNMKKNLQYSKAYTYATALQEYFGRTYCHMLGSNLSISVIYKNAASKELKTLKVEPFDPIYYGNTDLTHSSRTQTINYEYENSDGEKVQSDIVLRFTRMNTAAIGKSGGFAKNQGFVVERNSRVICRGKTHPDIWRRHPHLNGAGVMISFGEELDEAFGVRVTKNDINLSEHLVSVIGPEIKKHLSYVREIYAAGSATSPEVEELSKADDKFSQTLEENGASIGLPEVTTVALGGKASRNSTGAKKGTVSPRGTGRRASGERKTFNVPQLRYIPEPRTPMTHWPTVEEDGSIVVYVNTGHPFVDRVYLKGNEKTQQALRADWVASGLAHYDYKDTPEENTTIAFEEKKSFYLTKIYKQVV